MHPLHSLCSSRRQHLQSRARPAALAPSTKQRRQRCIQPSRLTLPYAGRNFPTRPLFGDTHLHTAASFDAGAFGARLGPRDALRFARGEEIMASSGQPAKLSRPLDFLVVSDHSDNMGFFPDLFSRQAGTPGRPGRPQVVQHDQIRKGRGRGDRNHHILSRRGRSRRTSCIARIRGPIRAPGRTTSRRRSSTTSQVASLHSSRVRVDLKYGR